MQLKRISLALFFALFLLSACSDKKEPETKTPEPAEGGVFTSFVTVSPLLGPADSVCKEASEVHILLPAGAEPHSYEPTPGDVRKLADSALLFQIGMGLDDWAAKIALEAENGPRIIAVAGGVPTLPALSERERRKLFEQDKKANFPNPHVWLDPDVMATMLVQSMARAYTQAAPDREEFFWENAIRYRKRLQGMSARFDSLLAPVKDKPVILHHGSFAYFCRRYGIPVEDILEPFPGREPSPKELQTIIENAREAGVVAILAEPQVSPKPARIIADELGIPVIEVDPLGKRGESYIELMERNVAAIVEGTG